MRPVAHRLLPALMAVMWACASPRATGPGRSLAIVDVALVDVDAGVVRPGMTVLIRDSTIATVGPASEVRLPGDAVRIPGAGRFLIPGLWDMHTHAHRSGRARWHYPLYLAHGVTGIRDLGTWADSAAAARAARRVGDDAPTVWWGSPPLDGVPPVLPFGIAVADPQAARDAAARFHGLGFRFLKVYDRIDRASYLALAAEARRLGIPLEGHVPLQLAPAEVVAAGQRTIEHLTLVLESCIPGALQWVAADSSRDAMGLLADGRLAAALPHYDEPTCRALFETFARAGTWHVPTLVQMRGAFAIDDSLATDDPRMRDIPAHLRAQWQAYRRETADSVRASGAAVFRRQLQLVGEMHRAGVPLLAGTDASDEPWVFPGSSLHDELALMVEAGLSPLDALRTATRDPARYRGEAAPLIAPGRAADLVLLRGDPTRDIRQVGAIDGVVLRGRYLDPQALAHLRRR